MDISRKTVLLAEDDPNDEELFLLSMEQANINCRFDVVRDGEELVSYLFAVGPHQHRNVKEPPDLLLLDLKMPKLNGLQVLTVLRSAGAGVRFALPPVVVFTSSDDEQDIRLSAGLGALSVVRKPVSHRHFVEAAQQTVLYWLMLNEPVKGHLPVSRSEPPHFLHREVN